MRSQDIIIGKYYRHKTSPNYGYAKAIKLLKPIPKHQRKFAYDRSESEKEITAVVVKCEWTIYKDDKFGYIRYFRPCNLVKEIEK